MGRGRHVGGGRGENETFRRGVCRPVGQSKGTAKLAQESVSDTSRVLNLGACRNRRVCFPLFYHGAARMPDWVSVLVSRSFFSESIFVHTFRMFFALFFIVQIFLRISPKEQRGRQSLYVARVRENRENPKRGKAAHPRRHFRCGAPAHSNQHQGSAKSGCEARRLG